jgi:fumarylacetoacetase
MSKYTIDATHDPALRSWVTSANEAGSDFPIQNLPFGRFRESGRGGDLRIGVAIGDQVLDLRAAKLIETNDMNALMAATPADRQALRKAISAGLAQGSDKMASWQGALFAQSEVEVALPCRVGDYTDFYTSIHHATSVGRQFRPNSPLLPNYRWVPIGYHGRSSSIFASNHQFPRPIGQLKLPDSEVPVLGPCRRLDYELELGVLVSQGNLHGERIAITDAEDHVFGIALFNDWSARDIQAWEYQPLGPFLSKNFASTLAPWIITIEALAPFRTAFIRPVEDPAPLAYLDTSANREAGAFDIELEVWLQTSAMKAAGSPGERLACSNYAHAYWTVAQLVAHHTVNGCNLQPGDLLGTGTLSGPEPGACGSLLELNQGGKVPIRLANGETRTWLEDGDTVILRGHCNRPGFRRIGFGECRGTVRAALPY